MFNFIKQFFNIFFGILIISSSASTMAEPLKVISSFSILSDLIEQVGGEKVQVTTLVNAGQDMHAFQMSPSDRVQLQKTPLIFINGLGFEPDIEKAARQQKNATLIIASKGVQALETNSEHSEHTKHGHDTHEKDGHEGHPHEGHAHGNQDPHAWQNPSNTILYVRNIRDALIQADPVHQEHYQARAERYIQLIEQMKADITKELQKIPEQKRHLMTTHQAFDYFAHAFDLHFYGMQGIDPHGAEISPKQLTTILQNIQKNQIKAVFYEGKGDRKLAETIAKNAGISLGGQLHSDTLTKNGSADNYIEMMRSNTRTISQSIR